MRCAAILLVAAIAGPLRAEPGELAPAFSAWVAEFDTSPAAVVAVSPEGVVTYQAASDMTVDDPAGILSISKTVAGQCVLHLVAQGQVAFEDTLSTLLGWSEPQGAVTVAQLLTHSGGIGPDATQRDVFGRNFKNSDTAMAFVDEIASRPLQDPVFAYNNENYFVLEAVIARAVAADPVDWCLTHTPVLQSLESFGLSNAYFGLGFAGGFAASARDLTLFFHRLDLDTQWPKSPVGEAVDYGPGIVVRYVAGQGHNLFHQGGVCTVLRQGAGALGAKLASGWSVGIVFSGCASAESLSALNDTVFAPFQ